MTTQHSLLFSVGISAIEVVSGLCYVHPDIASVKCVEYSPSPPFKDLEDQTVESFKRSLPRRLRHGSKSIKIHTLPRNFVISGHLQKIIESLSKGKVLAISSKVILRNQREVHIPLVDFQSRVSQENLERLISAMRMMDSSGGLILSSDNSYHYYGMSLLTDNEWRQFVGRCLLLETLVDIRYFGHCLIDGEAFLRISQNYASGEHSRVVAIVNLKA